MDRILRAAPNVAIAAAIGILALRPASTMNVTIPDLPTPTVNVTVPEQPPAVINIPEFPQSDAPVVNVTIPELPAPVVNVQAPEPVAPQVIYEDRVVEVEKIVEVPACLDYTNLPYFDLANALTVAFPGAEWSLNGSYYNGLTWHSDTPQPNMTAIIGGWLAHLEQDC